MGYVFKTARMASVVSLSLRMWTSTCSSRNSSIVSPKKTSPRESFWQVSLNTNFRNYAFPGDLRDFVPCVAWRSTFILKDCIMSLDLKDFSSGINWRNGRSSTSWDKYCFDFDFNCVQNDKSKIRTYRVSFIPINHWDTTRGIYPKVTLSFS